MNYCEAVRLQFVSMLAVLIEQKNEKFDAEQDRREDEEEHKLNQGLVEEVNCPIETNQE